MGQFFLTINVQLRMQYRYRGFQQFQYMFINGIIDWVATAKTSRKSK